MGLEPLPGVKDVYFNLHTTGLAFNDYILNSLRVPTTVTKFTKHEIYFVPSTLMSLLLSIA